MIRRSKRDVLGFIEEALKRFQDSRPEKTQKEIAAEVKEKVGKDWNTVLRWKNGGIAITAKELDRLLTELLGFGLDECLWFPDEVSEMHVFDVAYRRAISDVSRSITQNPATKPAANRGTGSK